MRTAKPEPSEVEMRIMHAKLSFAMPLDAMLKHPTQRKVLAAVARDHMIKMGKAQQRDIKRIQAGDID